MAAPTRTAPGMKGLLTVKVVRCSDLHNSRLVSTMDPYVKVDCGSGESFKTKVHENGGKNPTFEQAFIFNLKGTEDMLRVKVSDKEILTTTPVGRADILLYDLVAGGGGEKSYELSDVDNFRKKTGFVVLQASFSGSGGPAQLAEQAPISGMFHFQHNSTGFFVHVVGEKLVLGIGGKHDQQHTFEWQGQYIRHCAASQYLTGKSDGSLILQHGISEDAKWKWTGLGLQHVSTSKIVHPLGDGLTAGTPLTLMSGTSPASGFTLIQSTPTAGGSSLSPVTPVAGATTSDLPPTPSPTSTSASTSGITNSMTNMNIGESLPPPYSGPPSQQSHPVYSNIATPSHPSEWDLDVKSTWPESVLTTKHPHKLSMVKEIYQGTYVCDVCRCQGEGTTYHCHTCQFDSHPACARKARV